MFSGFDLAHLFTSGSGFCYPLSTGTLWQDAAGTLPVTADGQQVGFAQDASKGLALGPELVVDGGFNDPSKWIAGTGFSVAGGLGVANAAASGQRLTDLNPRDLMPAGTVLRIEYTVTDITAGAFLAILVYNTTSVTTSAVSRSAPGTYVEYLTATGWINGFGVRTAGTTTGTIDNISVQEVPGRHALQPSATLRPLLGRAIRGQRVNLIDPSEQFNIQPWTLFSSVQVIPNATTPPPQQLAASKIYPLSSGLEKFLALDVLNRVPVGSPNVCFFIAKKAEKSVAYITDVGGAPGRVCYFNLDTGVATLGSFGSSPFMIDAGDGWWICGYVRPTNGQWLEIGVADAVGSTFVTANGTDGIFIGGAQINLGTVRMPYQAIGVNAITITEAGVPSYPFVRFDGSDDRLVSTLNPTTSGTIACRFQTSTPSRVMIGSQGATDGRCYLGIGSDGRLAAGIGAAGMTTITGGTDIRGTGWRSGAVTWDQTTVKLYLDGAEVYSGAQSGAVNTTIPMAIGALNANGTQNSFFLGDILANPIALDYAATPAQIAKMHQAWSNQT